MSGKTFNFIVDIVPIETIKMLCNMEDETLLRKFFAFIICETAGGLELPTKSHRVEIAKEFRKRGIDTKIISELTKVNIKYIGRLK